MWGGGIGVTREGKEHVGGRERKISERETKRDVKRQETIWKGEKDRGKEDQERCREKLRQLKKKYDEDRTKMRETKRHDIDCSLPEKEEGHFSSREVKPNRSLVCFLKKINMRSPGSLITWPLQLF